MGANARVGRGFFFLSSLFLTATARRGRSSTSPPLSLSRRAHSHPPPYIPRTPAHAHTVSGSALQTLPAALKNPGDLYRIVGAALPASSNFFISYLQTQALLMVRAGRRVGWGGQRAGEEEEQRGVEE